MQLNRKLLMLGPLALGLAACGSDRTELDAMDAQLSAKSDADPAMTAALEDQIMVDPTLSNQANDHAIKPPAEPLQTPIPQTPAAPAATPVAVAKASAPIQTLGGLAKEQAGIHRDSFNGCGLNVEYSMDFAARLPDDIPLFPQSEVVEAAGSDQNGCKLRAITANAAAPVKQVARYYAGAAVNAGYQVSAKAEKDGTLVSGRRSSDGSAFYVILNPMPGGTSADLVTNNGL